MNIFLVDALSCCSLFIALFWLIQRLRTSLRCMACKELNVEMIGHVFFLQVWIPRCNHRDWRWHCSVLSPMYSQRQARLLPWTILIGLDWGVWQSSIWLVPRNERTHGRLYSHLWITWPRMFVSITVTQFVRLCYAIALYLNILITYDFIKNV